MTTIYVVGENFCSYTKDAWKAAEAAPASNNTDITYEKVDCAALAELAESTDKAKKEKLCAAAQGYPSFMDDTKTCTRGFKKCNDGDTDCGYYIVNAEITSKIEDKLCG